MDEAARNAFLSEPRTAVLSTIAKDGNIHAVPIWYLWKDGAFYITTYKRSQKVRNIERTGRATICVDDRSPGSVRYVTAEGPVAIDHEATKEKRLELWRHYRGAEAEAAMARAGDNTPDACWLILTPERWIG